MGINEQIKHAATAAEVRQLEITQTPMASQKTLRRRKRLCKQRLAQLEKEVASAKQNR